MTAMESVFPVPVATTFEVFAAIVSAAVYLIVGVAALVQAPRDIRARLFFATALASAGPYSLTVLLWARGSDAVFTLPVVASVGLTLAMGSLLLLHFTQVFPWRRTWIRAYWQWLAAGYVMVPVAVAVPVWLFRRLGASISADVASGGLGAVSAGLVEGLVLLVVLPVVFVLGLVVPFAALLSLYKTWLEAKAAGIEAARVTTFWILISQMAGGVLTILIIPLLHFIAPTGPWVTIAAVLLFAFGLLMPLAFAAGVWKYRVLDLDIDAPPTVGRVS
jgi:hypothetical protein